MFNDRTDHGVVDANDVRKVILLSIGDAKLSGFLDREEGLKMAPKESVV